MYVWRGGGLFWFVCFFLYVLTMCHDGVGCGVATVSRIEKIIRLFCRIQSLL